LLTRFHFQHRVFGNSLILPEAASFHHWFYRKRLPVIINEGYGYLIGCSKQGILVCACENLLNVLEQNKEAASCSRWQYRKPLPHF